MLRSMTEERKVCENKCIMDIVILYIVDGNAGVVVGRFYGMMNNVQVVIRYHGASSSATAGFTAPRLANWSARSLPTIPAWPRTLT